MVRNDSENRTRIVVSHVNPENFFDSMFDQDPEQLYDTANSQHLNLSGSYSNNPTFTKAESLNLSGLIEPLRGQDDEVYEDDSIELAVSHDSPHVHKLKTAEYVEINLKLMFHTDRFKVRKYIGRGWGGHGVYRRGS